MIVWLYAPVALRWLTDGPWRPASSAWRYALYVAWVISLWLLFSACLAGVAIGVWVGAYTHWLRG